MFKPDVIQKVVAQFKDSIPTDVFAAALKSALDKMELVSREEFDIQTKVLARTREKLEALEAKLANIENSFSSK